MKNILAENLLRFGVKNIGLDSVTKLQSLVEQVDPLESAIVAKLGDKSTKYWNEMTSEDKQKLLAAAKEKINRHAKIKKITFDKSLKKMKNVLIGTKPGETTITKTTPEVVIEEKPYSATYPENTKENPELQNFYLKDNETIVPENRKQKFEIMVSELKSLIPTDETIKEIHIKAGSATSKVPTTYGGSGKSNIENNVTLAEDRCKQIEATLNDIIKAQFPQYSGQIIIDKRDVKANIGPEWTNADRQNPKFGRPGNRTAEYNKKYGPYKGSVMIIVEGKKQLETEKSTEKEIPQTVYRISIQWGRSTKIGKKRRFRSKSGGGISMGGAKFLTDCPIW